VIANAGLSQLKVDHRSASRSLGRRPFPAGLIRRAPACQRRGRHGCCLERFVQRQIAGLHTRQVSPSAVDRLCRAEVRRFACVGTGTPRLRDRRRAVATCPSPFEPEATAILDSS
jgi:hypothetical protein